MVTLGVMVVVQRGEMVLLTQREDFAVWCLPGGGANPHERPDVAAIREVREETGLEVCLTRLVAVISRPHTSAEGRLTLVFAGEPIGGVLRPDPREVVDLGFFAPDALPEPLMFEHGQMVAAAVRGDAGHFWLSTRRMPPQFADRAALYRWRDESGLSRAEAYVALTRMLGEAPLTRVVGDAVTQGDATAIRTLNEGADGRSTGCA